MVIDNRCLLLLAEIHLDGASALPQIRDVFLGWPGDRMMKDKRKPMDPSDTVHAVNDSESSYLTILGFIVRIECCNKHLPACLSGDYQTNTFVLPTCIKH